MTRKIVPVGEIRFAIRPAACGGYDYLDAYADGAQIAALSGGTVPELMARFLTDPNRWTLSDRVQVVARTGSVNGPVPYVPRVAVA